MFPDSRFPDLHDLLSPDSTFPIPDFQNLESGNIGRANLEIWNLDFQRFQIPDFQICRPYVQIPDLHDLCFRIPGFQIPVFQICTTYVSGFQVSRFQISGNLESANIGRANLEIWNLDSRDSRFPDLQALCFQIPDFQICTTYFPGSRFQISRNLESGNIGRANLESGNLGRANLEICNLET